MPNPLPHLIAVLLVLLYPTGIEPLRFADPPSPFTVPSIAAVALALYSLLHAGLVPVLRRSADPARSARRWFRVTSILGLVLFGASVFVLHSPLWIRARVPNLPGLVPLLALVPHLLLSAVRGATLISLEAAPRGAASVRMRFFLGFALGPILLAVAMGALLENAEPVARLLTLVPAAAPALGAVLVFAMLLAAPFLLRIALGASPLRDPALGARFEALAGRARFRCRRYLVVPTGAWPMANAFVAGIVGPARYVFFTRALLERLTPDEAEAVLGHEMSHARRGHLVSLVLFFLAGLLLISSGAMLWERAGFNPSVAPLAAGYAMLVLLVLFGLISRRFESEADLAGAALTGSSVGYAQALEKVAALNGVSAADASWRHFSVARRSDLLFQADLAPGFREAYLRRCAIVRWIIVVAFLAGAAYHGVEAARQWSDRAPREREWEAILRAETAWALARDGDGTGAIREMESAVADGADSGEIRVLLARWHLDAGDRVAADDHYRASLERSITDPLLRLEQRRLGEELSR